MAEFVLYADHTHWEQEVWQTHSLTALKLRCTNKALHVFVSNYIHIEYGAQNVEICTPFQIGHAPRNVTAFPPKQLPTEKVSKVQQQVEPSSLQPVNHNCERSPLIIHKSPKGLNLKVYSEKLFQSFLQVAVEEAQKTIIDSLSKVKVRYSLVVKLLTVFENCKLFSPFSIWSSDSPHAWNLVWDLRILCGLSKFVLKTYRRLKWCIQDSMSDLMKNMLAHLLKNCCL